MSVPEPTTAFTSPAAAPAPVIATAAQRSIPGSVTRCAADAAGGGRAFPPPAAHAGPARGGSAHGQDDRGLAPVDVRDPVRHLHRPAARLGQRYAHVEGLVQLRPGEVVAGADGAVRPAEAH